MQKQRKGLDNQHDQHQHQHDMRNHKERRRKNHKINYLVLIGDSKTMCKLMKYLQNRNSGLKKKNADHDLGFAF